ncbi:unnamed protein product [Effrenium voratum]|nr:unnamed protein product [Effrenium voratum]
MMALDAKRASRDPPGLDPFACISARASCMPAPGDRDATKSPLAQILVSMVRVLVRTPALGLVTVILFLAVAGISIWQVSKGLGARLGRRLVMSLKTLFCERKHRNVSSGIAKHRNFSGRTPQKDPRSGFPLGTMAAVFPRCSVLTVSSRGPSSFFTRQSQTTRRW